MYKVAEDFFTSLGLPAMSNEFWENSILERPKDDRRMSCHANAWDFKNGSDVRYV